MVTSTPLTACQTCRGQCACIEDRPYCLQPSSRHTVVRFLYCSTPVQSGLENSKPNNTRTHVWSHPQSTEDRNTDLLNEKILRPQQQIFARALITLPSLSLLMLSWDALPVERNLRSRPSSKPKNGLEDIKSSRHSWYCHLVCLNNYQMCRPPKAACDVERKECIANYS